MLMFGGSTDPRTLNSVGFMPLRKIFHEEKCHKRCQNGRANTNSVWLQRNFSALTSILVSNLMGDSGLKWTCSAVFPPPGTTPSDGVTTRPGTAQTSCTWLRKTAEGGGDRLLPTMCCVFFPALGGACSPGSRRGSVRSSAAPPFWQWPC